MAHWGASGIWQERAERARGCAEKAQERADNATHIQFKRRMLKLAKRYEQMVNLAERAAKEGSTSGD